MQHTGQTDGRRLGRAAMAAAMVAAAETSSIISWLSKQRQSEWPHRLLLASLTIAYFIHFQK